MQNAESKVSVFNYTDYRKYLLDYYNEQKKTRRAFSYRFFAAKAGINSVGLYKDVIDGRQSLGRGLILKFSKAMNHGKKETEYFENMVYFNESKTVEERKLFFERMLACYHSKARLVDAGKYEYYSRWYYSAIRALLSYTRFGDDYQAIALALDPPIRPEQAKKGIEVLEKLEMIRKGADGVYELVDAVITSGVQKSEPNVAALNIVNFQKEVIRLAEDCFDRHRSERLDMSTLTLSISRETFQEVKAELAAFRQKISGMAERDKNPDSVYQFNMHLYPLTKSNAGGADGKK
jgi:uncharacterized protein (TIGR02147 family)